MVGVLCGLMVISMVGLSNRNNARTSLRVQHIRGFHQPNLASHRSNIPSHARANTVLAAARKPEIPPEYGDAIRNKMPNEIFRAIYADELAYDEELGEDDNDSPEEIEAALKVLDVVEQEAEAERKAIRDAEREEEKAKILEKSLATLRSFKPKSPESEPEKDDREIKFSATVGNTEKSITIRGLASLNGRTKLTLGEDGNLALTSKFGHPSAPVETLWASNTTGKGTGPYSLVLRRDGRLAVLDSKKKAIWQSPWHESKPQDTAASVRVYDDGKLVIYDGEMKELWSPKLASAATPPKEAAPKDYTGRFGVFPRPKDISKAYGGGKVIKPGYMGNAQEVERRRNEIQKKIEAVKRDQMMGVSPALFAAAQRNVTLADQYMDRNSYVRAEYLLRQVMQALPYRLDLAGQAMLTLGTALDAQGKELEAQEMYRSLVNHPNKLVRRDANRLIEGYKALEYFKLSNATKDRAMQEIISPLLIKFSNEYEDQAAIYIGTPEDEELAKETFQQGIILLLLLFLFPLGTLWFLATFAGNYN